MIQSRFCRHNFHDQAIRELSFKPTKAQLELLAELQTAKMPLAVIAARLGVDQAVLKSLDGAPGRDQGLCRTGAKQRRNFA
jgi:hypothetical protein